ncbi:cold shock domain-containing protein [candidate division KSB1 bacterium]|nr:cold shock domain-containing protein [candidate division KSB1 bacterium]
MEYGYVKSWDSSKGFGFIITNEDDELFVHINDLDITIKQRRLREGQRVCFDRRSDYRGDKAIHVRLA